MTRSHEDECPWIERVAIAYAVAVALCLGWLAA
jgi:hypothetical protein